MNCLWSGDKAKEKWAGADQEEVGRSAEHAQRGRGQELCRPKERQATNCNGLYEAGRHLLEHLLMYKASECHLGRRKEGKRDEWQAQACKNGAE